MTFLSARLASWRYMRGNRSLEETLAAASSTPSSQDSGDASHKDGEEGYDVPEEMEEVLGLLLNGLRDRDTVVRWSAAKGCVTIGIYECMPVSIHFLLIAVLEHILYFLFLTALAGQQVDCLRS